MSFSRTVAISVAILGICATSICAQAKSKIPNRLLNDKTKLLKLPEVRKELKIDAETVALIKKIEAKAVVENRVLYRKESEAMREARGSGNRAKRKKIMKDSLKERQEARRRASAAMIDLLSVQQDKRLAEITTQAIGWEAVYYDEYAAVLRITEQQRKKLSEKEKEYKEVRRKLLQKLRNEGKNIRETMDKVYESRVKAMEAFAREIMTEKQIKDMAELKGKPFKFQNKLNALRQFQSGYWTN